jgi:hypothetical protein
VARTVLLSACGPPDEAARPCSWRRTGEEQCRREEDPAQADREQHRDTGHDGRQPPGGDHCGDTSDGAQDERGLEARAETGEPARRRRRSHELAMKLLRAHECVHGAGLLCRRHGPGVRVAEPAVRAPAACGERHVRRDPHDDARGEPQPDGIGVRHDSPRYHPAGHL